MGIFDFLNRFRSKQEQKKSTNEAITAVKAAAQASNYNQASIKAFEALEIIGEQYAATTREVSMTAREYGTLLAEDGNLSMDDFQPIIHNFEIAKYSPDEVTFDDYRSIESALETIVSKYKKPGKKVSKGAAKTKRKRRRKPRKRAATGRRNKQE